MAIYHLSVKTISRSAGRSATAAAAYRAGVRIDDEATGEVHDYRRKGGVESATLVLPAGAPEWASDRAKLWNAAEGAEKRKNSTVAREFEIALPEELTPEQRKKLAVEFARQIVERHQCAADVAIHAPGKEGDTRNHHAHILLTTRRLGPEGLGEKTRELDDKKTGSDLVKEWRGRFAMLQNAHLQAVGQSVRVDHRTLEAQGIEREPTKHLGVHATAIERRTRQPSRRRLMHDEEASKRLAAAKALGETERSIEEMQGQLIVLNTSLAEAKKAQAEKEAKERQPSLEDKLAELARMRETLGVPEGVAQAMRNFRAHQEAKAAKQAAEAARAAEQAARQAEQERQERARRAEAERLAAERAALRQQQEEARAEKLAEAERQRRRDEDRGYSR